MIWLWLLAAALYLFALRSYGKAHDSVRHEAFVYVSTVTLLIVIIIISYLFYGHDVSQGGGH